MRIVRWMILLATILGLSSAIADDIPREGCFSCRIQINSLDQPISLAGKWLFTRDDNPQNKDIDTDTSQWVMAKAPGPWKKLYDDKQVFSVGWYRGNLEFNPSLVGEEVVLLVNTYMARTTVYVDGKEIYHRPNKINVERYYSTQAIPVLFKVTQPHHLLAIRVDTPLMAGVYQLPFEIRKYDEHDVSLVAYKFLGGEARQIAGYVVLSFGFFFLMVYWKTRYSLYLVSALISILVSTFFGFPSDYLLSIFSPETMLYLHYPGIYGIFLFYGLSQYYHTYTPKINWIGGTVVAAMALTIGSMAIHPNLDLFQHVRSIYFLSALVMAFMTLYKLARGMLDKKPGARVLFFGVLFFAVCAFNDVFLALGLIESVACVFIGLVIAVFCMLYVSSNMFANTFRENRHLVKDLKGLNENLEQLVDERTLQLRQKTHDIESMLQNIPEGILTIMSGNIIHPEYSAYLEEMFETKEIAGKNIMELVFSNTNLGSDALSQVEATMGACIDEDSMNFDFNSCLLIRELDKGFTGGRTKSLELSWSPIANENDVTEKLMLCLRDVTELKQLEAAAGQQERELEIIGQILLVNQEKFHDFIDSSGKFISENERLIRTGSKHLETVTQLFRNMHTIKGNARTFGLLHLTNLVHEAEQTYDELRNNPDKEWDEERLLSELQRALAAIEEYAHINDIKLGRKGPGRRGSVEKYLMVKKDHIQEVLSILDQADVNDVASMRLANQRVHHKLNLIGTETIKDILTGIFDSLPSLAKELGKEPPEVIIIDNNILVRAQIADLLKNVFMHLYRNSMDHGIETAAERIAKGKPAAGRIQLELALSDGRFWLRLRDDGRGLPLAVLRDKGIEKGLLTVDAQPSPEAVAQLIFAPGFSTAAKVTEVSGRGVGMDAVKSFVINQGGSIELRFLNHDVAEDFRAFETVICLPGGFAVQDNQ